MIEEGSAATGAGPTRRQGHPHDQARKRPVAWLLLLLLRRLASQRFRCKALAAEHSVTLALHLHPLAHRGNQGIREAAGLLSRHATAPAIIRLRHVDNGRCGKCGRSGCQPLGRILTSAVAVAAERASGVAR